MAAGLLNRFSAPYPCDFSARTYLRVGLITGGFVFLFFWFLQPFGLGTLPGPARLWLYAGYGLLCALLIAANSIVLPKVMPREFREDHWTIGRHILYVVWVILSIGLASYFFTRRVFLARGYSLEQLSFGLVVGGALAIGAIPVTIMTLIDQIMLLRRSDRAVAEANIRIEGPHVSAGKTPAPAPSVKLVADNGKDSVEFRPEALLYISAEENYVTIHTAEGGRGESLLRSSLTRVERQVRDVRPEYFRCHRAYIVNPGKICKVSGNAQGLKLTIEGAAVTVPVARRYVEEFRRVVVPRL